MIMNDKKSYINNIIFWEKLINFLNFFYIKKLYNYFLFSILY